MAVVKREGSCTAESVAVGGNVQYVERRYGGGYRLLRVQLVIRGPDGGLVRPQIDAAEWYRRGGRDAGKPPARHGPDFRSVHWYGDAYQFSELQAAIVKLLWEAWANGTPDVGGQYLMEAAGTDRTLRRMDSIFAGHPAWGRLLVSRAKGSYRLAEPDQVPGERTADDGSEGAEEENE